MNNALRTVACTLVLSLPFAAAAQAGAPASPAADGPSAAVLQKLRERIRTDPKGLVAQNLPLSESEAKAFWPAYEKCHAALDAAHRKTNRAILDYVNGENRMTDALAKQIVGDLLKAEAEETRARKSCYDRVAKVLPGKKAARYLQIESKIQALSRFDVAVAIPLVD